MFAISKIFGTKLLDHVIGIGTSIFVVVISCSLLPAQQQVQIDTTRDAACINIAPDNNFGAHVNTPVGVGNDGSIRRGLYFFDVAGNIPAGATITNVEFLFDVVANDGSQQSADFVLHLLFADWDEGTGTSDEGEATFDGASWNDSMAGTAWDIPGGVFSFTTSGGVLFDNPSGAPTTFSIGNPTSNLIQNVQFMLDNPEFNFGLILRALDESTFGSATQVVSREGADGNTSGARLIVDFTTDVFTTSSSSFTLDRGFLLSGSLNSFRASDDQRLVLNPGFTLDNTEAPVWLQFSTVLGNASPASLDFSFETQASTPGLTATYDAFNYNIGEFEVLGEIEETFNVDSVVTGQLSLADHIDPTNALVLGRIGWRQTGFVLAFPWEVRIDHVFWSGSN